MEADSKQPRQKTWGVYVNTRHAYGNSFYMSNDLKGTTTSWEELKILVKTQFAAGARTEDISVVEIIPWDYVITP